MAPQVCSVWIFWDGSFWFLLFCMLLACGILTGVPWRPLGRLEAQGVEPGIFGQMSDFQATFGSS
jgi:hypothetical protein